jgi:acyl carrier protein
MPITKEQFLSELATILELDSVEAVQPLTDGNWDSVAIMSTIALVDEHFNVSLPGAQLSRCTTPQDILNLIDRGTGAA